MKIYDVLIVGGGPCGLACGIEAKLNDLSYIILEKGNITESIRRYPINMSFFSTSENIEIGSVPFTSLNMRPGRAEALKYYRKVTDHFDLNISLFTNVENIRKENGGHFTLITSKGNFYTKKIILAIGYYDVPRELGLPGEDLPHVNHYFDEPYKYTKMKVVVVGGANSAVETALELFRNGAHVTLVHQFNDFDKTAKYWIVPDMENRIRKQEIHSFFNTEVKEIHPDHVIVQNIGSGDIEKIEADFVFLMTGYRPDADFLRKVGIKLEGEFLIPTINEENFETNIPGIYMAGSVVGGEETAKIFIENGREHGKVIIKDIMERN